jgi:hypothetical protein
MLAKRLSTSERYARLFELCPKLAEFAQSLYPLLVAHSDDFGRQQGDAFTVQHQVHPTSPRRAKDFEVALQALHDAQLITLYDVDGRRYLEILQFDRHQAGLHKRTKSEFPEIPGNSRLTELKRTELKRSEAKGTELKGTRSKPQIRSSRKMRASEEEGPPEFLEFWQLYPRKIKRAEALEAWTELAPSPELVSKIMNSLNWQIHQPKWAEERGRYIPHPISWLNKRRWEDEPFNPPPDLNPNYHDTLGVANAKAGARYLQQANSPTRPTRQQPGRLLDGE